MCLDANAAVDLSVLGPRKCVEVQKNLDPVPWIKWRFLIMGGQFRNLREIGDHRKIVRGPMKVTYGFFP